MQAMERCIAWCDANREEFEEHFKRIVDFRRNFEQAGMKYLRLFSYDVNGKDIAGSQKTEQMKVCDIAKKCQDTTDKDLDCGNVRQDITRLVFMVKGITGMQAAEFLEEKEGLVFEMAGIDYITAISTVMDSEEDIAELLHGLQELDEEITRIPATSDDISAKNVYITTDSGECSLKEAIGRRITDYIYVYPPGIPIIAPFELIDEKHVSEILHDICAGYEMRGNIRTI